jgi:hypothetical protein
MVLGAQRAATRYGVVTQQLVDAGASIKGSRRRLAGA